MLLAQSLKREAILRSGLLLFAHQGFDATSVSEIQSEARVSRATFFAYFPSKERLASEIYQEVRREVDFSLAFIPLDSASAREKIHELWTRMADLVESFWIGLKFLEFQRHDQYLGPREREDDVIPGSVLRLLEELRRHQALRNAPILVLASILWGTFIQLLRLRVAGQTALTPKIWSAAEACCWDAICTSTA